MATTSLSPIEDSDRKTLTEIVRNGKAVLFVGSGVSSEAKLPSPEQLVSELKKKSGFTGNNDLDSAAEHFERRLGRAALVSTIKGHFDVADLSAPKVVTSYDLLAALSDRFNRIVTTNWDDEIEKAFRSKGVILNPIKSPKSISSKVNGSHMFLKLHGDFHSDPEDMVITKEDYRRTYKEVQEGGGLFGLIGTWLQTSHVFFVGYSLKDQNFNLLFEKIKSQNKSAGKRHYAIVREMDDSEREDWIKKDVRVICMPALDFFRDLFIDLKEFVNREQETEYLCNTGKKPFVEIYGPIGSGKSELLSHVKRKYEAKEPLPWTIREVSWNRAAFSSVTMSDRNEFAIIGQLTLSPDTSESIRVSLVGKTAGRQEEKARELGRALTEEEIDEIAAAEGAQVVASSLMSKQVLLLFDEVDRLCPKTVNWLDRCLVPRLWKTHPRPDGRVRVVFAGRYKTQWNSFINEALYLIKLSPLDDMAVGEMLDASTNLCIKGSLPNRERWITRLVSITGGHPLAIRNILKHLAVRHFSDLMPTPKAGEKDFFQLEHRTLFEQHVYPVIKPVLENLTQEACDVLFSLSVFRRFNRDILEQVSQTEHDKISQPVDSILREWRVARLIEAPQVSPLDALDSMMRYILSEYLRELDPSRFIRLHQLGASRFDKWICGTYNGPIDSEEWRTWICESMFHHATLVQSGIESSDDMARSLKTHLENFKMPSDKRIYNLNTLSDTIKHDKLIRTTLTDLSGDTIWDQLQKGIDDSIEQR